MTKSVKLSLAVVLATCMLFSAAACGETAAITIADAAGAQASANDNITDTEVTGATGVTESSGTPADGTLHGSLTLTGSTSMSDVATALAEAFMAENPDLTVSVGGNGSGEGPTAVND